MQTSRTDLIASVRRHRDIGSPHRPKTITGETSEQAIARGCPYTVIAAPVIAHRCRPDFVPGAPAPAKPRRSDRWAPGTDFCPPELRYTAEEFDRAASGMPRFPAATLAALRRVAVDGERWGNVAADMGVRDYDLRGRFKRFNGKARATR